jgi:SAM-dependent methyltransferase
MPPKAPLSASSPKEFWNRKASTFPRYAPGGGSYEARALDLTKALGAVYGGATVLDVGCGSGMFTIRLAMEAKRVMAVDISERMLAMLEEDARKAGVGNIDTFCSDWLDFEAPERPGCIFASMSPAIGSEEGRLKLLSFHGAQVVAITASERFCSQIMEAVYSRFGPPPPLQGGGPPLKEWLRERGLDPVGTPLKGVWRVPQTMAQMADSAMCALSNYGLEAKGDELSGILKGFQGEDGLLEEVTAFSLEILIWRNPEA